MRPLPREKPLRYTRFMARKLHGRMNLHGFDISIENGKGTVRRWYDPHGKESGSTPMHYDYGYIRGTRGTDGDHVDVYVGPNPESVVVFIIDQMKKKPGDGKWTEFDEQKVMLGFKNAEAAKAAYMRQYDDPRFFGGMKAMGIEDFRQRVMPKGNHGKKVANARALALELRLSGLDVKLAEILGDSTPGITELPAATSDYSAATQTKKDERRAEQEIKSASKKVENLANRLDDVGIGMLAAPSVAQYVGEKLEHARSPRLKALGGLASAAGKRMKDNHLQEIAGLALVAPVVTHNVAKGLMSAKKKHDELRKLAAYLHADFEYLNEGQKTAVVASLRRLGQGAAALMRSPADRRLLASAAEDAVAPISRAVSKPVAAARGDMFEAAARSAGRGVPKIPQVPQTPGRGVAPAPQLAQGGKATGRGAAPTFQLQAATAAPSAAAPVAAAPAAGAARGGKWDPSTARNMLLLGGAGVGGLGLYGGYKGIQTASNLVSHHNPVPLAPPPMVGIGRAF